MATKIFIKDKRTNPTKNHNYAKESQDFFSDSVLKIPFISDLGSATYQSTGKLQTNLSATTLIDFFM